LNFLPDTRIVRIANSELGHLREPQSNDKTANPSNSEKIDGNRKWEEFQMKRDSGTRPISLEY
jgi:hypothetical protein